MSEVANEHLTQTYVGGKNEIEEIKLYYVLDDEKQSQKDYQDGIINQRDFPTIENFETGVKGANDIYTFSFEKPERQKFYRLLIVAKDRAENCNYLIPTQEEYNSDLIMVDSIMPTVILAPDAKSAEVDSNQGGKKWYRKERKITYDSKISDVHSGLFESTVTINGREEKFGPYVDESTDKATFNKTNSVDIKTGDIDSIDGHVTLEAKVQDNAGNINTCTETIYIDEDAPVIGEILFTGGNKDELTALPTQYGFFFQNETKVTVKATDYIGKTSNYIGANPQEGSGVKDITYYTEDSKGNKSKEVLLKPKKDKEGNYTATFTIPKGFKGQIYLKAQDQTGQETSYMQPKGTVADIEHVQEKDDIYTLQVAMVDKAGNEVEGKILYSVNRFGSVYQYGKETSELLANYYTKEGQELQITETNVDTLTKSRITYSRGGEIVTLTEGENYKVSMSGGEDSMKQYHYTIYKENFQEEGEYSVVMTSQDAAENQSDNRLKGKEIQFVVDRTAPSIVFSGVEEKGQYEEHTREISLNVEDNIGTKNVEVWCDNQMVQSFDAEELAAGNGTVKANLTSSDEWQELTIVARDMTGNESRTEPVSFLLTTNAWIQWYYNKPVFYLSLAGAAAVLALAGAGVVIVGKRRKLKIK